MSTELKVWKISGNSVDEAYFGETIDAVVICSEERLPYFKQLIWGRDDEAERDIEPQHHGAYYAVGHGNIFIDQLKVKQIGIPMPDAVEEVITVFVYGT